MNRDRGADVARYAVWTLLVAAIVAALELYRRSGNSFAPWRGGC